MAYGNAAPPFRLSGRGLKVETYSSSRCLAAARRIGPAGRSESTQMHVRRRAGPGSRRTERVGGFERVSGERLSAQAEPLKEVSEVLRKRAGAADLPPIVGVREGEAGGVQELP